MTTKQLRFKVLKIGNKIYIKETFNTNLEDLSKFNVNVQTYRHQAKNS